MSQHNMSGMRSSLESFRNDVCSTDYDVIIITETWLQSQHLSTEIFPSGWTVFRKDRSTNTSINDCLGGGVIIAVRDVLSCSEISLLEHNNDSSLDIIACQLQLNGKSLFLSGFYLPPKSTVDSYDNLANLIIFLNSILTIKDDIFIFGDANMPGIKWIPNDYQENIFDPVNISSNHYEFLTKIFSLGICQVNNLTNNSNNVLDIIFTNVISDFKLDKALLTLTSKSSVHHVILSLTYYVNECIQDNLIENKIYYDFDRANYDRILQELDSIVLVDNNINLAANNFYEHLKSIIDKYVPKKIVSKLTCPPHFDKTLRILRNKRNKAHKKYKKTKNPNDLNTFFALRE